MSVEPNQRRFAQRAHGLVGRLRRGTDGRESFPSDSANGHVAALHGARSNRRPLLVAGVLTLLAVSASLIASSNLAQGQGGTAKPPQGAVSPFTTPTLPDPAFSVDPRLIHGFDMTGFMQNATVSNSRCPAEQDANRYGGTVTINNTKITVPCGIVIQMPANTFRWADFVNGGDLSLGAGYPVVRDERRRQHRRRREHRRASCTSRSSRSTAAAASSGDRLLERPDRGRHRQRRQPVRSQINDPNGRFGRTQSPDPRLSVDDANPTIHAATGYPMCVPRTTTDPRSPTPTTRSAPRKPPEAGQRPVPQLRPGGCQPAAEERRACDSRPQVRCTAASTSWRPPVAQARTHASRRRSRSVTSSTTPARS